MRTFTTFDLIFDNVKNVSFYEEFSTDMAIGVFPFVARDVADIDIPEPFLLSYRPCPFKDSKRCRR